MVDVHNMNNGTGKRLLVVSNKSYEHSDGLVECECKKYIYQLHYQLIITSETTKECSTIY